MVFWKAWEVEKPNDLGEMEEVTIPVLRYYTVFNVEQCSGIKAPLPEVLPLDFEPIAVCEQVADAMPKRPAVTHAENRAYYSPSLDVVNLPKPERFRSVEEYYSTLFHELAHSTGHPTRLNRKTLADQEKFGSPGYAREELIAEMGCAFLCARCRIETGTLENSAAYIQHWLERMKDDSKLVILAAAQGQKAAEFILGQIPSEGETVATAAATPAVEEGACHV